MTYAIYTQWDEILYDFSIRDQHRAYIDLLAFGMFVIDKSTDCLVDPTTIRIDFQNIVYNPEMRQLLRLVQHRPPRVTADLPIWRRTDPGQG